MQHRRTSRAAWTLCFLPFLTFLLATPIYAQDEVQEKEKDKDKEKIKVDGFVRSFVEAENFKNGELFHEVRIDMKTKRRKGFRGNLEVDVRTKTDDLQVNEAYIDKKWDSGVRMKAGYDLKRFGLEYEESRLERPTIERSLIYRRLDVFTYTGRESVLRFEKESADGRYHDWSMTAAVSEAENFSLIGNWQTDVDAIDARYGFWFQAGIDKIEDGSQGVAVMMHSLWHRRSDNLWQLEWVTGLDPNETEFQTLFDDDERIYFTGLNTLYGRTIFQEDDEAVSLQGGLTAIVPNTIKTEYNSVGGLLGIRYDLDALRVTLNVELIGSSDPLDFGDRNYNESSARLEAIYAF